MTDFYDKYFEEQYDNGLSSYTEIPVNLLSGWISF